MLPCVEQPSTERTSCTVGTLYLNDMCILIRVRVCSFHLVLGTSYGIQLRCHVAGLSFPMVAKGRQSTDKNISHHTLSARWPGRGVFLMKAVTWYPSLRAVSTRETPTCPAAPNTTTFAMLSLRNRLMYIIINTWFNSLKHPQP